MNSPFQGTHILLVTRFDEVLHAHNVLRRRALERLGCTVASLDPAQRGLLTRLRGLDLSDRIAQAMGQHPPDLVVVIGGEDLDAAQVQALKRRADVPWVIWHTGDLRSLAAIREVGRVYDRVAVAGTDMAGALDGIGVPVLLLPLACDPSFHRPMRARAPYRANVVFVGNATPRREQLLSTLVEFGLAVWGYGWRKTGLKDYCRGELETAENYVRAYAGATVAVNIHHSIDPDPTRDAKSCNERVFELAAIGSAQVVDYRADLPRYLEPGREVLVYQHADELRQAVQQALEDNAFRERVAAAGRERALREHTYMHRMVSLLQAVKGPGDTSPQAS
jgi:spore maturation protein CgeB